MNATRRQRVWTDHLPNGIAVLRWIDACDEEIVPTAILRKGGAAAYDGNAVVGRGHDATQAVAASARMGLTMQPRLSQRAPGWVGAISIW